jgi:hypothetical protein
MCAGTGAKADFAVSSPLNIQDLCSLTASVENRGRDTAMNRAKEHRRDSIV